MKALLSRQIRKYLPEDLKDREDMLEFLDAVLGSYENLDNQFKMNQRAMKISSDELFEANVSLRKETAQQRSLLNKLEAVINKVDSVDSIAPLKGKNLAEYINEQAEQLILVNKKQEQLLRELALQNQELSDYAHIVSHDLKSPLRSIDALVTWLKEDYGDGLGEKGLEQIELINTHLEKMDALISGILNYSAIDRDVRAEATLDLMTLVEDTLAVLPLPPYVEVKVHKLPSIRADHFKVQQLFQNLICNAAKSIDKPTGKIEVLARKLDYGYQFEVSDSGKGIDAVYFDKIFKVFQKLEHDSASTGIGLSIVKKIVSSYGGEIWLDSELGKGTTFYFTLPQTYFNDGAA